ncbi:MAG TPA: hypothetical protein VIV40_41535 [Kofleriaceae bacterium]
MALLALIATSVSADSSADTLLATAYDRKARGDEQGAVDAFVAAREAGAAPQRIALELAYVHISHGEIAAARLELEAAAAGPDQALAAQALHQLAELPSKWWADFYAESFGWRRARGETQTTDLVPMVRLRGLRRLSEDVDIHVYAFLQATRDVASRGFGAGVPQIYADNRALGGGGLLWRLLDRRVGLFAQAGPALSLINDGKDLVDLDVRGGAFFSQVSAACNVQGGIIEAGTWCAELYSEAVYTSRFDHDVQGFFRARTGFTYVETGPVSWQVFMELRGALDRNGDYYDNFIDSGFGPRWRLHRPIPLDLLLSGHVGSYLGRENVDPKPQQPDYVDLRLLMTTYWELD